MVKVLSAESPAQTIGILVNNAADSHEAQLVFSQLDVAARRFLKRGLEYYGFVAHDPGVREAVLVQRAVVDHLPQAPASRCFRILASRIAGMDPPRGQGMHLVSPMPVTPATVTASTERPQCA
jgi:flagellar biosynthesis protein FlhG